MRYFDTFNAKRPEGIENKGAHIIGGGIAGLAAAVFLIDDGYMDGRKIAIYEKLAEMGGSMDGTKNEAGYLCRGERELEPHMECLWYLFSKIPSIDSPGMTVLDETVEANREDHIYAHSRVLHKQGKVYEAIHSFKTSDKLKNRMLDMSVFQKFAKYISHRLIKRDNQRFSVFRHIDSYRIHIKNDILYLYMNEASLPDTCAEQKIGDHPALVFHVFTRLNIRFFQKSRKFIFRICFNAMRIYSY